MNIDDLLKAYKRGELDHEQVRKKILAGSYLDLGIAKLDHLRQLRRGLPEAVFCQGKDNKQLERIYTALIKHHGKVLGTRATEGQFKYLEKQLGNNINLEFDPVSRLLTINAPLPGEIGLVAVLSAGAADLPVAEEAAGTAEFYGSKVKRHYDCGVAGIHRLFEAAEILEKADCVIVVAGMDGALPSVVSGLSSPPVIAVPTSVGYGSCFEGLSALLAMLNSCSPGISVVNIDNGFGAGYLAHVINSRTNKGTE